MQSEISDFENEPNFKVNFEEDIQNKTIIYSSKYTETYKFKTHNKWVCYKCLTFDFQNHPLYIHTLENEFSIGYELDHPNIIQYYNLGKSGGNLYLIKEFIDGIDIKSYFQNINSTKIYQKELKRVLNQLLDTLLYLHSKQVYHLDLKPSNILITNKGNNVKLIDFGLSTRDNHDYISSGTKKYSSPEQIHQPNFVDGRSDIYALGKMLKELIDLSESPLSFFTFYKFNKIVSKCVNQDQNQRFFSITDIVTQLNTNKNSFIISFIFLTFFSSLVLFQLNKNQTQKESFKLNSTKIKPLHKNVAAIEKLNSTNSKISSVIKQDKIRNIVYETADKDTNFLKTENINSNIPDTSSPYAKMTRKQNRNKVDNKIYILSIEDKNFCENIIDSLEQVYSYKLKNREKYIDPKLILYEFTINLIKLKGKKIEDYIQIQLQNDSKKRSALLDFYEQLKKESLEKFDLKTNR